VAPAYRNDLPYLEYTTFQPRDEAAVKTLAIIKSFLEPTQYLLGAGLDAQTASAIYSIRQ